MKDDNINNVAIQNSHEYIDLGLSSGNLWATCNIGAEKPEDAGNYYAWGETKPKEQYEENNCKMLNRLIQNIAGDEVYDVARKELGEGWSIPNREDFNELCSECTWTIVEQNGIYGYLVTGVNGNSIFLPGAGCRFSVALINAYEGLYWTSDDTYCLKVSSNGFCIREYDRMYGLCIRAVYKTGNKSTTHAIQKNPITYTPITSIDEEENNQGDMYVDLSLPSGTKWASCNLGANTCEETGIFYTWGEQPATRIGNKYVQNRERENIIENSQFDTAHWNYGGNWHTPTKDDFEELRKHCKWSWTTHNGVKGYKVTGINGNSIFLPVTGFYCGMELDDADTHGYYWSINPDSNFVRDAYFLYFNESGYYIGTGSRYYRRCVRPVYKQK